MFQKNKRNTLGFTLVELLVVIFILGLLAGILYPAVQGIYSRSKSKVAATEIQQLEAAIILYETDYRNFPPTYLKSLGLSFSNATNEGIESLVLTLFSQKKDLSYFEFKEDHLENTDSDISVIPLKKLTNSIFKTNQLLEYIDPWGNPYIYFHFDDVLDKVQNWYMINGQKIFIKPDLRQDKMGLLRGMGRYQLRSLGPDTESIEDDIQSN